MQRGFFSMVFRALPAVFFLITALAFCSSGPSQNQKEDKAEASAETRASATERAANVEGKAHCIEGDCTNGEGTYVWEDGSRYVGHWQNGKFHGNGVYYWSSGDRYQGQFANGDCEGTGIYIWANGARYEGQWKAGKIHGKGSYIWPNGQKIENAEFENHHLKPSKSQKENGG